MAFTFFLFSSGEMEAEKMPTTVLSSTLVLNLDLCIAL